MVEGKDLLWPALEAFRKVREGLGGLIPGLRFAPGKIDGPAIEAAGGSGLEASHLKAEFPQAIAEGGDAVPEAASCGVLQANVQKAPHEGAGGNDDGTASDSQAQTGLHPARA
jgi:hypothetical protein